MPQQTPQISRRGFLAATASVFAAPYLVPASVLGRDGAVPPSEQLLSAVIGIGNRSNDIMNEFLRHSADNFRIVCVCDCFDDHAKAGKDKVDAHYKNSDCKTYARYEDILDRKDIDVVAITTPDHWHTKMTIEACRAGKDVFCEKPLTLTLMEGRQIVAAARKYNRVCTSGSQRVFEDYGYMAPIIQSGAIGQVKEVFFDVGNPPTDCYFPEEAIPSGRDWDRWLGQAPWAPYSEERSSGSYGGGWRRFGDYGNGFFADWGAHKIGGALYACGMDDMEPVEILPPECEKNPTKNMAIVYPNGVKFYHARGQGHDITIVGTDGEFRHNNRREMTTKPLKAVELRTYSGGARSLVNDFAYCVRNRLRPFQDLPYGAKTAAACQLGNICYKLGRPLQWDAAKTEFVNDDQANRFVSRPQRGPYTFEV